MKKKTKTKIRATGGSSVITLKKSFIDLLEWSQGDTLELEYDFDSKSIKIERVR